MHCTNYTRRQRVGPAVLRTLMLGVARDLEVVSVLAEEPLNSFKPPWRRPRAAYFEQPLAAFKCEFLLLTISAPSFSTLCLASAYFQVPTQALRYFTHPLRSRICT